MHVLLDRTLQFLIFHLSDHGPNWIPCGSSLIIEKGETRLQHKLKKIINPASLNNPVVYNLIAVMKNAHKNAKQNKKQKLETKPSRLATI